MAESDNILIYYKLFLILFKLEVISKKQIVLREITEDLHPKLKKPRLYKVYNSARDLVHYLSVPLGSIKSIEFMARIGSTTYDILKAKPPDPILGCFGCCGQAFGVGISSSFV